MIFLKALFIVIEVICCLLLIGLVLLQKSKSEGLGLAFGAGAGESMFGARAGNVLSKATVVIGAVFIASSLILSVMFAQQETTLMGGVESDPVQPVAVQPGLIEGLDTGAPATEGAPAETLPAQPAQPAE
ncbi:Protein-export membrane protein SecG [Pontiella desulfatans]|uniref:Protein-export membrane protein SecG n=1 Tax=Pontiella desulfatans TaxID=2750659 RepID=A0A6C2U4Y4_PONDE|nr:preprotein translocase subunit SecG [Pontiella desulfatans]VGO14601.1 Protein-export membrane protein SecG [Pontiella desulfatans]